MRPVGKYEPTSRRRACHNDRSPRRGYGSTIGVGQPIGLPGRISTITAIAISVLLYACADDRDLDARRARPASHTSAQARALGWHLGPALHSARRQAAEHRDVGAGGGRRQPPRQRSCGIRTYWTGKGREIPRLRFVKLYNVSQGLLVNPDERPHCVIPLRP